MLRPYQNDAINQLRSRIKEKPLLVLATGGGKTHIFAEVIRLYRQKQGKALVLVHRDELVRQAASKLQQVGIEPGIVKAGYKEDRSKPVQVASVQTAVRRQPLDVGMVIVDEAHHVPSAGYQSVLADYPDALVWGCTATPFRLDGKGLGVTFGCIVEPITMEQLIEQGHLIRPEVWSHPLDLGKIHVKAGDYRQDELAAAVHKPKLIGDIVATWQKRAAGMRTVCFGVTVAHSKAIVQAFLDAGVPAEHLDGESPTDERRAVLARLERGETLVVSNCALFGEGVDIPALQCAVLARPTLSMSLYRQQVGRIMRPLEGKSMAVVLDHGGCAMEHGLPWDKLTYSLSDRVKKHRDGPVQRCPECFMVIDPPAAVCPHCGAIVQRAPAKPKVAEPGELERFQSRPLNQWERARTAKLIRHLTTCINKGYKERYATAILYKNECGHYPSKRIIEAARDAIRQGVRVRDPGGDTEMVG